MRRSRYATILALSLLILSGFSILGVPNAKAADVITLGIEAKSFPDNYLHISTFDGNNQTIERYALTWEETYTIHEFDLSTLLPDAFGLYRVKIWFENGENSESNVTWVYMKINDKSLVIDTAEDTVVGDIRPQLVESDDLVWYSTTYEAEIRFIAWPAPVANAGGPYAGYEGQIIELDASNSTGTTTKLSYRWDYGNDRTWDYSSTDPRAVYTLPDAGVVTVLLEVSDGTMSGTATTTVTVNNMSPSALITSVTGVISSSSKPGKILILGDGYSEGTVTKDPIIGNDPTIGTADVLRDANFTVDIAPVKSNSWTGANPSLDDYALVILLVGANTKSPISGNVIIGDIPPSGQTALMHFVMNGGGFLFQEWVSLRIRDYGYYAGFQDLVMLDSKKWDEIYSADTYNVTVVDHPITKGLPQTFQMSYHGYSNGHHEPGATALIQGNNPNAYDAVIVKEFNAGKVVEFSWANNHYEYEKKVSPWNEDLQLLYRNAASWASGRMGVSTITAIQNTKLTFNVESSDTGLNQDLAYTFTWGDGSTSIVTIPATDSLVRTAAISHTYPHSGPYAATLSVSDSLGATSLLQTVKVTIQREPVIANAGPDQTVTEGTTVTFDASRTTSSDESILTYVWDFGDGSATEGAVDLVAPTHLYPDNGVYTVTVTVTDDIGLASADTMTVTVTNVVPTVEAGANLASDEGSPVTFSGSFTDPGADAHTIAWVFGDGATANGTLTPTHTYVDNGVYTVTLTVTDDDGGVGVDTLKVTVTNVAPTVEAGANLASDEGSPVTFSGSFTDPGADTHTIAWVFGDGATTTGSPTPTHTYTDDGVYTVKLTVTDDDGGVGVDSLTVTVLSIEVPTTSISLNGTQGEKGWYTSNVAVTLNAEGDTFKAIHYSVDGGAENVVTTNEISFTISTQGIHTITYHSVSVAGLAENEQTAEVKMDWTAPTIDITSPVDCKILLTNSTINLEYTANDNVDDDPTIVIDPSSFTNPLPEGDLTITITITDAAGYTATDSITVTILSIEVPTTSIALSGTEGENGWYTSNVAATLSAEGDTFKELRYSVDGGTENVLSSTETRFNLTTEGVHTITYYSVSIANLTESVQTSTVNIDWTAPTIDITSPAQDEMFFPTSVIDLQYTVSDIVDANPTITVDPSSFPSPLPLGDLTITITATDAAGNTATKSITVKVQETTVKTPRQLKNDAKSLLLGSKTGIRDIDYAIDAAVALIDKSLNPQYWIDDSHLKDDHGIKVFIYEGKAAGGLQTSATLYDKSIPTLQKLIDQMARQHKDTTQQRARLAAMQKLIPIFKEAAAMLAEADEGLAKTALDEANALTPPKNGSSFATALKNAEKEYNDGLSDEAAGNPTKAIEDFKQSWIHSRQAAHIQGGDKHWNGGSEC